MCAALLLARDVLHDIARSGAAIAGVLLLGMVVGGIAVGLARAAQAYRGSGRPGGGEIDGP